MTENAKTIKKYLNKETFNSFLKIDKKDASKPNKIIIIEICFKGKKA